MDTRRTHSMLWFGTGAVVALIASLLVLDAWRADAGDPGADDTTFVPMTACRLVDTRPAPDRVGPHGSWGHADTKTLQATGVNGQCTIPVTAVGLSMNVTALNATADGFLTFWDTGPRPLAASLNPSPGQAPIPNAVNVKLSPTGSFMGYNERGNVDVVIDANGYFVNTSVRELHQRLAALEAANPGPRIAVLEAQQPQLITAQAESGNVDESIFGGGSTADVLTVSINAPAPGKLFVIGSVDTFGSTYDRYRCDITINGVFQGGAVYDSVSNPGSGHTNDGESQCVTTSVDSVSAGSFQISLRFLQRETVGLDDANLWAIWTRN